MTDLARMTSPTAQIDRAIDDLKLQAIDEFALASAEEVMLKSAEKRLAVLEARRRLVLRTFDVTDVAKLGEKLAKNKYAAEKLHEIFGGAFELLKDREGKPFVEVEKVSGDPDVGEYRIYTLFGRYTRPDGKIIEQMGSFSTKDAFFAKAHDEWKTIDEVNIVDVMVAAQTECYKKCLFRGVGLGDWTDEEARTLTSTAKGHDFSGSQAGAGQKEAIVGFGRHKGKKVADVPTEDLAWLVKAYGENVASPERAKYRDENQRMLDALKAEQERRARSAEQGAGEAQPASGEAPKAESAAGDNIRGDVWTRLVDAAGKQAMPVLRALVKELCGTDRTGLSDCTEDELRKLATIPEETLKATAQSMAKAKS